MSTKKVSAFSVYKEQRQEEEEEDGPSTTKNTDTSTLSGVGNSTGEGERREVGKERKRKKDNTQKRLSKKRRTDSYQESGLSGGRELRKKKKLMKRLKKKITYKQKVSPRKKRMVKLSKQNGDSSEADDTSPSRPTPTSPEHIEVHSVGGGDMVIPFFSQFDPDAYNDSRDTGWELFRLLINPLPLDKFFDQLWEQRPLFLSRHKPRYNDGWFSTQEFDRILRENSLEFSTNVDITSYKDGKRYTHNPDGRAVPQVVWDCFEDGCSIRLLNPQTYSHPMWLLTATLQEYFQSFVGANVYLTPAGTQGFAPHSDDIEAFVMQLEGKKRWKLYSPRESSELLPRHSSRNLTQEEVGKPILDVILEPGDLLYFPRGTFHQAESLPETHSLHVTLSTYQKYTWGDMMAKLMSSAVEVAMQDDVTFRRGLPLGCLNYTGRHNKPDTNDSSRVEFMAKMTEYMEKLIYHVRVDDIMDQLAVENVHSSLPPCFTAGEKTCSVHDRGSQWKDGKVSDGVELTPDTEVKIARFNSIRLVTDSEGHTLYYNHHNSRVFQEKDLQGIPLDNSDVKLIKKLIWAYPDYIKIEELITKESVSDEELELLHLLYSQAIILVH